MTDLANDPSACLAKIRYETREAAKHTARHLSRRVGKDQFVYRCEHCAGFHTTSARNRNGRAIR